MQRGCAAVHLWLKLYLASQNFGNTVDNVKKLMKKYEAIDKSTARWAKCFAAMKKSIMLEHI